MTICGDSERTCPIKKKQNRFDLVLRGTHDGIWDCYIQTGDYYFSERWTSMLGYRQDAAKTYGILALQAEQIDDWLHLTYSDDGKGINAAHLSQIFDPFFTTAMGGEGTGYAV